MRALDPTPRELAASALLARARAASAAGLRDACGDLAALAAGVRSGAWSPGLAASKADDNARACLDRSALAEPGSKARLEGEAAAQLLSSAAAEVRDLAPASEVLT